MKALGRRELIEAYLSFFESKGHVRIPSAPLIPENDPTVLFTTAGMHPLVPFLLGQPHPLGKRLCNVQKCLRTDDIEKVGDEFHHTFFEMLGNWSLGDYFKKEAIEWSFEFLTKVLEIPVEKLAVSCFAGNKDIERDEESAKIWQQLGIDKERIAFLGMKENWWGPVGKTGPCGPDTEMFVYVGKGKPHGNPGENPEDWCEIWNDVFMQYYKDENGNYTELEQKNVDTGMGVERVVAILNGFQDNYMTEIFQPIIKKLEELSKKKYGESEQDTRAMRIIADHLRAAVFVLSEGIAPGNKEQGYVLRRLIRRAIRFAHMLGIKENFTTSIAEIIIEQYEQDYGELSKNRNFIMEELSKEENRFRNVLEKGLRLFEKTIKQLKEEGKTEIDGKTAFLLYQSYGFPVEMTEELAKEQGMQVNMHEFEQEYKRHQELSRTATAGKFKSGLADMSEQAKKLHTATHLLHAALRKVLGEHVQQKGSNITAERLRFDFKLVNEKIQEGLPVRREEMTLEEAKKRGALAFFEHKYGDKVSVYFIGEPGKEFSIEVCAGPHVSNTRELGKFKIVKEESVAAGVRRIKAVLE